MKKDKIIDLIDELKEVIEELEAKIDEFPKSDLKEVEISLKSAIGDIAYVLED